MCLKEHDPPAARPTASSTAAHDHYVPSDQSLALCEGLCAGVLDLITQQQTRAKHQSPAERLDYIQRLIATANAALSISALHVVPPHPDWFFA